MDREIYCHSFNLKTKTLNKQLLFKTSVKRKQELFYVSNKRQTSVAISPNGQFMVIATDDYNKNTKEILRESQFGQSFKFYNKTKGLNE